MTIALADLEQLIRATLLVHDAMCSPSPTRQYDWEPEVVPAIRFVSHFSSVYTDSDAIGQALVDSLSPEDVAEFMRVSGEVQMALGDLLAHDKREDN